jgi:hypothetical protein
MPPAQLAIEVPLFPSNWDLKNAKIPCYLSNIFSSIILFVKTKKKCKKIQLIAEDRGSRGNLSKYF